MQSQAKTVAEYLRELPEDRRRAIQAVRKTILASLDGDYEEGMQYGMIGYYVPHSVYPPGYHCDPRQPLPFACLASQKNYMSLYLGCMYSDSEMSEGFRAAWAKTGKKLDMGKSCIRFKKIEDLPLEVIADAIKKMPVKKFIELYERVIKTSRTGRGKASGKTTGKASPVRKSATGLKSKSLRTTKSTKS